MGEGDCLRSAALVAEVLPSDGRPADRPSVVAELVTGQLHDCLRMTPRLELPLPLVNHFDRHLVQTKS